MSTTPTPRGGTPHVFDYVLTASPVVDSAGADYYIAYFYGSDPAPQTSFNLSIWAAPTIQVGYCSVAQPQTCSPSRVTLTATTAPTIVTVVFPTTCSPLFSASSGVEGAASGSVTGGYRLLTNDYNVAFVGSYGLLEEVTYASGCTIEPEDPPDPPDPEDP